MLSIVVGQNVTCVNNNMTKGMEIIESSRLFVCRSSWLTCGSGFDEIKEKLAESSFLFWFQFSLELTIQTNFIFHLRDKSR